MKSKKNYVSIIFIIVIGFVCIYTIAYQGLITLGKVKFTRTDNWQTVEKSNNRIYDKVKTIQVGIENRVNNYFPFFKEINNLYYKTIIDVDSLYLDSVYLKNNSSNEKIMYNKNNSSYYLINNYSPKDMLNKTKKQVSFYNNLVNKYKDISFYIYLPQSYEMVSDIKDFDSSINYFKENIDKKINYKILDATKDNYYDYYYKTDHHLNSYGAEKVYKDVLTLFNINDQKIYNHKIVYSKYYGSAAKSVLIEKYYDKLNVIDEKNTLKVNIEDENFKRQEIEKKDNKFYDYYIQYFNGQYDEVIYHNKNNDSNDNLLIISDSLIWQFDYLLANHFNNTHVINMRYGKWKDNDLNLSKHIEKYHINKVLFLMQGEDILFDGNNFNLKERVK